MIMKTFQQVRQIRGKAKVKKVHCIMIQSLPTQKLTTKKVKPQVLSLMRQKLTKELLVKIQMMNQRKVRRPLPLKIRAVEIISPLKLRRVKHQPVNQWKSNHMEVNQIMRHLKIR